jgi:hypothetical protein
MLAASRGHLPIISYLLTRAPQRPDPFVRNTSGETAFDCAAANFEVRICEVIAGYERETLRRQGAGVGVVDEEGREGVDGGVDGGWDAWKLHEVIPIVVWENQRLDLRVKSLSRWGRGRWRREAISVKDGVGGWELEDWEGRKMNLGDEGWEAIRLGEDGLIIDPKLKNRSKSSQGEEDDRTGKGKGKGRKDSSDNSTAAEPSNSTNSSSSPFYFSSQPIPDLTNPFGNPTTGWSYSSSFSTPPSSWTAEPPEELDSLLNGKFGPVTARGLGKWVRRRKWVRLARRKNRSVGSVGMGIGGIDMERNDSGATFVRELREEDVDEGDYLGMANVKLMKDPLLMRGSEGDRKIKVGELRESIELLESVTEELRNHILGDENKRRRGRASKMLEKLFERLELMEASMREDLSDDEEVYVWGLDKEYNDEDDDDDDEGKSVYTQTYTREEVRNGVGSSHVHIRDLPEVQLPRDEVPVINGFPNGKARWEMQRVDGRGRWVADDEVKECKSCQRYADSFPFVIETFL